MTRVITVRDGATLVMPGARLLVLRGPDKGRAANLSAEQTVVGTGPSADLQLTDTTVSRSHMTLTCTPNGYLIEDLGSTNGTRLEGRRVRSAYIEMGDKVTIGATTLRLQPVRRDVELVMSERPSFGRLLGRSVAARRLFALLEQVAQEDVTVLLTGETGTGKDAAAEAIHENSPRAFGPFIVVDCSALSGELLESELFGHERGAFTGAHTARAGAFEEASGGTLFLDEIGELPREQQPKLLRALERREVRPLGASQPRPVDIRVIAATNRDLKLDVNQGRFREDLFYRLNVVAVRLPPLRERPEDIALLAEAFWQELKGDPTERLPADLVAALVTHEWPGNVRELRNRVERAALLAEVPRPKRTSGARRDHREATTSSHRFRAGGITSYRAAKAAAVEAFERTFLEELLERAHGNLSEASRLAAMDRVYLSKLVRKYRIR